MRRSEKILQKITNNQVPHRNDDREDEQARAVGDIFKNEFFRMVPVVI